MIKAVVEIPFYEKKGKELYLDEDRFFELEKLGLVKKVQIIETASIKNNGKKRILSKQNLEDSQKKHLD